MPLVSPPKLAALDGVLRGDLDKMKTNIELVGHGLVLGYVATGSLTMFFIGLLLLTFAASILKRTLKEIFMFYSMEFLVNFSISLVIAIYTDAVEIITVYIVLITILLLILPFLLAYYSVNAN